MDAFTVQDMRNLRQIARQRRATSDNLDKPVTREEILREYLTLYDAFGKAYGLLGRKAAYRPDAMSCGLMLGVDRRDHYRNMTEYERTSRNQLYRRIEEVVSSHATALLEAIEDSQLPAYKKQNLHQHLFWGECDKFDPQSTSIADLRQLYDMRAEFEKSIFVQTGRKQRISMDGCLQAATLAVDMAREMKRLKEKDATREELDASLAQLIFS